MTWAYKRSGFGQPRLASDQSRASTLVTLTAEGSTPARPAASPMTCWTMVFAAGGTFGPDGDGGEATAAPSQAKRSLFGRLCSPNGPLIQVLLPSVNAVQLSARRHTSRPFVVRWSPSPFSGL